jgi:hypothetical protein
MPNWTLNRLVLTLPSPKRWEPIEMKQTRWEIFRDLKYKFTGLDFSDQTEYLTEFFNIIKPRPKEEEENWNNWNISNWGTKWEPNFYDIHIENNTIILIFATSWCHPNAIYLYLERLNFEIEYCYASYENCDYGWGGNEWDDGHHYEIIDFDYEGLHEELQDEEELYYFDRIVNTISPEIEENGNLTMINFMINSLSCFFDAILDGYYNWRIENNIDESNELKKNNLKLKNKIMEWLEDDVEKQIKNEDTYIKISNTLKDSNYKKTQKKLSCYLWVKFQMIHYYNNKPEPELDFMYC